MFISYLVKLAPGFSKYDLKELNNLLCIKKRLVFISLSHTSIHIMIEECSIVDIFFLLHLGRNITAGKKNMSLLFAHGFAHGSLSFIRLRAEHEPAGMRINTFISEAIVLSRKRVKCLLQVSDELLPQAEEFQYLRVLLVGHLTKMPPV